MNELVLAFDVGLAVSAVAVAWFSVVARDTFASIVAFVAYGLMLSLAWMRLSAPDVALTEAAIGSGLTGVLLLGVAAQLRPGEAALDLERPGAIVRSVPSSTTSARPNVVNSTGTPIPKVVSISIRSAEKDSMRRLGSEILSAPSPYFSAIVLTSGPIWV